MLLVYYFNDVCNSCGITQTGDLTKSDRAVNGILGLGQNGLSIISQLSSQGACCHMAFDSQRRFARTAARSLAMRMKSRSQPLPLMTDKKPSLRIFHDNLISVSDVFPHVSFNFAGCASMHLRPHDYLIQQNFVIIVYDLGGQQIGLADYDCSLHVNVSLAKRGGRSEVVNAGQVGGNTSLQITRYELIPIFILAYILPRPNLPILLGLQIIMK
ncbi:putative aspartic peptidase A1 family, aspartic peptidase domain superfamily [Helianthus anomalus]